jgi:thiamine biosynthesis protein ThiC
MKLLLNFEIADVDDVRNGVISSKIAAHAADKLN